MKTVLFLLVLISWGTSALAAEEYVPPKNLPQFPVGEDKELFKDEKLTAKEFFEKRRNDEKCQKLLKPAAAAWIEARADLELAAGNPQIKDDVLLEKTTAASTAKDLFMKHARDCGPCAVRPMKIHKPIKTPDGGTEYWYESHGSCQLDSDTAEHLFKRPQLPGGDFLKPSKDILFFHSKYPRTIIDVKENGKSLKRSSGFTSVILFKGIDADGKENKLDGFENKLPATTLVSARGPDMPVVGPTALSYIVENFIPKDLVKEDQVYLRFRGVPAAKNFTFGTGEFRPKDWTPQGNPISLSEFPLVTPEGVHAQVIGQWYVTRDGYFRYYTAANFGFLSFVADEATITGHSERVQLEVLLEFYERILGAKT